MVFGRKKRDEKAEPDAPAEELAQATAADGDGRAERPAEDATQGPWDAADVPDDGRPRVDLGGLLVPVPEGVELRVEVAPDGNVVAAVVVDRGSQLQLNAFAAPRFDGIWGEIRLEIAQSLKGQGHGAEEVDGPFGRELRARIPGAQPGTTTPARFVGTDGPRWFLRGLITGPAATDLVQASVLHDVFRGTVVVRGKDAMAPRDPLVLHLPREAAEAAQAAQAAAEEEQQAAGEAAPRYEDFDPFERGPEITETR